MNGNHQGFNDENRYEMRKRKRMNRILNASILVVGALIVFFAVQLFLPGSEEASEEENQDNIENEESEQTEEETAPEDNPQTDNQQETEQEDSPETNTENEQNQDNDANEQNNQENDNSVSTPDPEEGEGNWEPIGTEQSGSFTHDFNRDSQNWAEMEAALRYATGLSEEEMETWQIENGGGPNKVTGTVSTSENADTPFQVTMEFIENEGWKPLKVERLDSNPYSS
ncbi:YrrS family protein [Salibacterium aidingense]|uniref:YrrS family protein n=1 Tax=Salibacterium aidingense TaxID=384933 RepID=UPI000684A1E5|nr:YrrS family protein [Salibacterium aidingense]